MKEMKNHPGKGSKNSPNSGQGARKDRKSSTGMTGSPKKGGHGGKFTWYGDAKSHTDVDEFLNGALDFSDPNFEDDSSRSSTRA